MSLRLGAIQLQFESIKLWELFNSTNIYLVDPASSHMLVSKIKPCMSKYGSSTVKLRMAH